MSTTVDQRVVEMRFDNQQFERNVSTTMSTLDKFKQKLNFSGASKGLEDINSAARNVDMSVLSRGVETVGLRFNAMYTIADQTLRNIINRVEYTAERMISALTIDPISTGFQEYETQINAVQTILANTSSKGSTLQDVNTALDTLNTYADKTIYNFTEMTRNIGTFTAAGVDLDTSVSAIQGIANLAAVSGSTSQQASTAMYQLSQALAAGKIQLMDWNSVVNAGMGGQVFQDALVRTATVMGTNVDALIKKYGSFRESLTQGDWLTSEVLTKTLQQFTMAAEEGTEQWERYKASLMEEGYTEAQATEILKMANTATDAATKVKTFTQLWNTLQESAQSGWTESWEIMIGDFEEAKATLTEISDTIGEMIGKSAESRNTVLREGLSSGWKQLLSAGIADEEGYKDSIKSIAKEHGIAFDEIIKKTEEAGGSFEDALIASLKDGTINSDILTESVSDLANKMSSMTSKEREAAGYTDDYVQSILELDAGLKDGSISMDEFVKKMTRPSGRENIIQALWNSFNGLLSIVTPIKEAFYDIFPAMTGEQLYAFTEGLRKLTEHFTISETTANNIKRTFKGFFAICDIGVKVITTLVKGIAGLVKFILPAIDGFIGFTACIGDFFVYINDAVDKYDIFNKGLEKTGEFLSPLAEGVKEFAKAVSNSCKNIYDNAKERLDPLASLGEFIKSIFTGIAGLISKVAPTFTKLAKGLGDALSTMTDGIADSIQGADYNKLFDIFNSGVFATIGVFIAKFIKSADGILGDVGGFTESIQDILGGTSDALNAFTSSLKADTLKKISVAIGILAVSLLVLASIDSEKLGISLGAITALFVELIGALTVFSKLSSGKGLSKLPLIASSLIALSIALVILSAAVKILSTMSWDEMKVGLVAITVGLGALVAAVKILSSGKLKNVDKAAKSIRKLSTALLIFAVAMKIMGSLSWSQLAVGLTGTVVGLAALVIAMNKLPKNMTGKATGVLILSAALIVLSKALKSMSTMSWTEIAKSLVTLAGSLLILTKAMSSIKGSIIGAVALVIVTEALKTLTPVLQSLGSMSLTEIGKSLVALAGSLIIIAGAMALMKKAISGAIALTIVTNALKTLTPVLQSLGSMSLTEIAKGLGTLAGVFIILGVAGAVLGPLVPVILALSAAILLISISCAVAAAGVGLFAIGLNAINTVISSVGVSMLVNSIQKMCTAITQTAPMMIQAFVAIILALVDAIKTCIPAIVEGLFILLDELLDTLITYAPKIVNGVFDFFIVVMNALAEKLPDFIKAGTNLLMALFSGIIDSLKSLDPKVLVNGILAVGLMAALMYAMASIAALTPAAMLGVLGFGAVIGELSLVLTALGGLAQIDGLDWLISEGGNLLQTVGNAIGKFVGGLIGGIGEGVSSSLPEIGTNLSSFMENLQPFIEGAKSFDGSTLEGVKNLSDVILALTAANLLDSLTSWLTGGGSSLVTFGEEIAAFGPHMKTYADSIQGIDVATIEASATAAKALSELASNLPNSGGLAGFFAGENDIDVFGKQLPALGEGLASFSSSAAGIVPENITAAAAAAKELVEMTSLIPNEGGVAAWFAGDNSISSFGDQLPALGAGLSEFSTSVSGIVPENIIAAATAAKSLAEMSTIIPNEGGLVAWFTGDNSIASFASQLPTLGIGLLGFSTSVSGIVPENIIAAATAAKSLAEMSAVIPNEGGMVAWFTGENSLASFASQLPALGTGLLGFSMSVSGIVPENIIAAATAAKTLAEMSQVIPNEGGIAAWFTGESSIASFASQLPALGTGLLGFSMSVAGIVPENIIGAANAAKEIANLTSVIPNEGGIAAWFTGESSIASFASQLPLLGNGLLLFSTSVAGIVPENIIGAANAAKEIASLTSVIPNEGGVKAWFTGETSLASFGLQLPALGTGLLLFSTSVAGIVPENITAAVTAAKQIASLTEVIPTEGGVKAWFTGETSLASFGNQLPLLGTGLLLFSTSVAGIVPENITAAVTAAKEIASLTSVIPNEGGVKAWFTGETSLASFGSQLPALGTGLSGFSTAVEGIVPENITAAANAAKALAEMTQVIPPEGGIKAWFSGESSISSFADKLPALGAGLKDFSDSVAEISPENVTAGSKAAKSLAEMASTIPENTSTITSFGYNLKSFGTNLKTYFDNVGSISGEAITTSTEAIKSVKTATSGFNDANISSSAQAIKTLVEAVKSMSTIDNSTVTRFSNAMKKIGETNVKSLLSAFDNAGPKLTKAGQTLINDIVNGANEQTSKMVKTGETALNKFSEGIKSRQTTVNKAWKTVISKGIQAIKSLYKNFYNAGSYLVDGFADGITANTFKAKAKAVAMAKAALKAAEEALGIASPSKEFYKVGDFAGQGFINALYDYGRDSYSAGSEMADSARVGLNAAMNKVYDIINGDMDMQPTIRPVLDLSDVSTGAGAISGLFNNPSIGVMSNVGAISSMMNKNQNGTNNDIISAINKLRDDLGNSRGDTYQINGITYDDGSNISEAVSTLVRAARMERRI